MTLQAPGAFWSDNHLALYVGNCLHMDAIPDNSVHCVVTSPPYLSKRKYKTEPLVWGGTPGCEHQWGAEQIVSRGHPGDQSTLVGTQTANLSKTANSQGAFCHLCGAWRGHLGLEPSPELFIAHLIEIFREVKRVLRDDGTCWVNLGDTHAGSGGAGGDYAPGGLKEGQPTYPGTARFRPGAGRADGIVSEDSPRNRDGAPAMNGCHPGDLIGIPWRFALAMQADGWHLHQDIIWHKPAPMPESVNGIRWERHRVKVQSEVDYQGDHYTSETGLRSHGADIYNRSKGIGATQWTDCPGCPECAPNDGLVLRRGSWRPTASHEYIFMFSKGPHYYADREGVKERKVESTLQDPRTNDNGHRRERGYPGSQSNGGTNLGGSDAARNLRSVWKIGPENYNGAHFATFPSELPTICIKASTSERGVCPKCGSPYARIIGIDTCGALWYSDNDGKQVMQGMPATQIHYGFPPPITEDLQSMRCCSKTDKAQREFNSRKSEGKALSGEEQRKAGQTSERLSGRAGEGKGKCSASSLLSEASREKSVISATAEGIRPNGSRQNESPPTLCKAESAIIKCPVVVQHGGLGTDIAQTEEQMLLLPQEIFPETQGDNRPCDTVNEGRQSHSIKYSGGLSPLQFAEARQANPSSVILGWRATCQCAAGPPIPATVLDPFAGTFTTGLAAKHLGRRAIGYELSEAYAQLAIDRNRQGGLL